MDAELARIEHLNKGLEEDNKTMRLKYSNQIDIEKRVEHYNLIIVLLSAEV